MADDVSVFGRPASKSIADSIMQSPTLNAVPSPSQPQKVPVDGLMRAYARLYAAAIDVRKDESDLARLGEVERIIQFSERALNDQAAAMGTAGPPVPSTLAPPPPQPAAAPPQAPPQPAGAAAGVPAPGGPPTPGAVA